MQNTLIHQYNVAVPGLHDASATTIIGPQNVFSMTGILYEMARGNEPIADFAVQVITQDGLSVTC